jgi:hypothetical protein
MKIDTSITRREAMRSAIKSAVAASVAAPFIADRAVAAPPEPEFIPENEYPFFGYEPEKEKLLFDK